MGANAVFLDTNVLVHASVAESPLHARARDTLSSLRAAGATLWTSRQVIMEFLAVLTLQGVFGQALELPPLLELAAYFQQAFQIAEEGPETTRALLDLLLHSPATGRQVQDANIVATMLASGIGTLLTRNVRDFKRYADKIIILPLR